MSFEKPSLYNKYVDGDIRGVIYLIEKYSYTNEEVSEVINIHEPDENGQIPEVEHIEVLLEYFPNSTLSEKTIDAIKKSFPHRLEYIMKLKKSSN